MNNDQKVKLLPERTVNTTMFRTRITNLCEAILVGKTKWEGDEELIRDIFYILKPDKLVRKDTKLRYGDYLLDFILFGYNYEKEYNNIHLTLDKRDTDMVYSFRDIIKFDISIIIEVLKTALYTKQYHLIPVQVLIVLAACELELPIVLQYKPLQYNWDMSKREIPLEKSFPLKEHKQNAENRTYEALPVEQRGLLTFSSKRHQEEKRQEYEKRKARLADREAHKKSENTDKEQAG